MKRMRLIPLLAIASLLTLAGQRAQAQTAELQIIHNCADPVADSVDIYVGTNLAFDNFAFRTATNFLTLPAGIALQVGIAPKNSTTVTDTLVSYNLTLTSGQRYVAIASGVLDPASFAFNPDGRNTGFTLNIIDDVRTTSANPSDVDFFVVHGSTDAPTVDVVPMGTPSVLVNDAAYGDATAYLTVPSAQYTLNITPGNDNSLVVASYSVDLSSLGGGAAVVFASGFLSPGSNQNGPAFGLFAALPSGTVVQFNENTMARLQVIHNCSDPAAAAVDVYLDTTLLLDNFGFREATGFVDVPAGIQLNIGIADSNSTSSTNSLVTIPLTLQGGQTYVAVASGVLNTANFAPNPDGISTSFGLSVQSGMFESSTGSGAVALRAYHGATDAPTVDVILQGDASPLIDDLIFANFSGSLEVPAASYNLNVTPGANNAAVVASYTADLSTLGGGAAVVFASGFLDPSANQNGASFGLFAALTDGTVIPLPANNNARLQVIHNCADPGAALVDVYLDTTRLLNDFPFRGATPFIDAPAGVQLLIGIAPSTSASVADTLVSIPVTLQGGQTYVAVASGVLTPASFAVNPDGVGTGFQLLVTSGAAENSSAANAVRLFALHGATDAPTVDVVPQSSPSALIDDLTYAEFSGTLEIPAQPYVLNITPGNNNNAIVASYNVDLSALGGASAVVFASGFLDSTANQNGPAFGLFAALTNGTVVAFPAATTARVQVIHNAADPIADTVDVYAGSTILINNFAFRTATAFIDVPAGTPIPVGIALSNSTSASDTIPGLGTTINLTAGQSYVIIANGVSAPASFAANPDGRSTAFQFFVKEGVRESAAVAGEVDFVVLHGATDAPTVDVIANQALTIVDNAAYGDITSYINVPAAVYSLDVALAAGSPVVASYTADLSGLGGGSAVVFASGFLTPSANQNGEAFGLFAALTDGTVVPFQLSTSVEESNVSFATGIHPNPAAEEIRFALAAKNAVNARILVTDITGRIVMNMMTDIRQGQMVRLDVRSLNNGVYNLTVMDESSVQSASFVVTR